MRSQAAIEPVARTLIPAIFLLLNVGLAFAEVSSLSESDTEQRNAAAAFALTREASIPPLIGECSSLLRGTTLDVEATFRGWYERNRTELETAYAWLDHYLLEWRTKSPEMYQRVSNELVRSVSAGGLQNIRTIFKRQLPNQSTCEWAVKTYAVPQLDLKNIAKNPGYEQFGEFGRTLDRIRNEPGFKVPTKLRIGYETAAAFRTGISNMATLDAAEAAKERGDGQAIIAAFQSLVQRGDGTAAQSIGMMYFNGDLVQKNSIEAYHWFYTAWSLADYDGLNAIGVMLRDGIGVNRDLPLAQAAFMLATVAAKDKAAHNRALSNADRLGPQIDADGSRRIACLSLRSLDDELRKPVQNLPTLVPRKSITGSERRLGALIPRLSASFDPDSCK